MMGLTCYCTDNYSWWYSERGEAPLVASRSKRCCSCRELVRPGDIALHFTCWRDPRSDIEERIYIDEVPMADKVMCEECGDLYSALSDLGFCITLGEDMHELVRQYAETYGQKVA